MRQLTDQEQKFIGGILMTSIIALIPYVAMTEITRQPMINWGMQILKTNDPLNSWGDQLKSGNYTNIYLGILYVIIVYAKVLSICPLLLISVRLTIRMGFPNQYPENWRKYLNFYCKQCRGTFLTRTQFNSHKKICKVKQ